MKNSKIAHDNTFIFKFDNVAEAKAWEMAINKFLNKNSATKSHRSQGEANINSFMA